MIKNTFRCPLTTAVFTNKQVITQGKLISIVIHDVDDGSWKFFSKEEKMSSNEQVVIVSLEEILMIDPSVSEIAHLPEGALATRRSLSDHWKIVTNAFESRHSEIKKSG